MQKHNTDGSRDWAGVLVTALAFGLTAYIGVELTRQFGRIAALWPANAILLTALMLARRQDYSAYLIAAYGANVIANFFNHDPLLTALFLPACNSIEVVCAVSLMRRYAPGTWMHLEQPRVLGAFWVSVCLISPLVSGLVAAIGLKYLANESIKGTFGIWFPSDAMGLAVVTPLLLILLRDGIKTSLAAVSNKGALLSLLLLLAITALVFFQSRYPFIFLVFPPLVVVAFFADFLGVAIGLLCVAVISIAMTISGSGPLSLIPDTTLREQILVVQVFLAALLIMGFPVAASLSERRKLERNLGILATTDALTGLATRRGFEEHFRAAWADSLREGRPIAIMMLDVDFFKAYNDCYGHLQGDDCIKTVAGIIKGTARRPLDMAVRYGGEEFLLLLPHTAKEGALRLTNEIHQLLAAAQIPHRDSPHGQVTISIGLADVVPDASMTSSSLIEAADRALYQAKRSGRSRTEVAEVDAHALMGAQNQTGAGSHARLLQ